MPTPALSPQGRKIATWGAGLLRIRWLVRAPTWLYRAPRKQPLHEEAFSWAALDRPLA